MICFQFRCVTSVHCNGNQIATVHNVHTLTASAALTLFVMSPPHLVFTGPSHSNASTYTLATLHSPLSPGFPPNSDRAGLLTPQAATPSYGATFPRSPTVPSSRKLIVNAAIKMAALFVVSTLILGGTLWFALPTLEQYVVSFQTSQMLD